MPSLYLLDIFCGDKTLALSRVKTNSDKIVNLGKNCKAKPAVICPGVPLQARKSTGTLTFLLALD